MEFRQRAVVATLWTGVALVMALTLEPAVPTSADQLVRLFVVVVALALAAIYLFDPKGLISRKPFE